MLAIGGSGKTLANESTANTKKRRQTVGDTIRNVELGGTYYSVEPIASREIQGQFHRRIFGRCFEVARSNFATVIITICWRSLQCNLTYYWTAVNTLLRSAPPGGPWIITSKVRVYPERQGEASGLLRPSKHFRRRALHVLDMDDRKRYNKALADDPPVSKVSFDHLARP